jgi:hypothetical protein
MMARMSGNVETFESPAPLYRKRLPGRKTLHGGEFAEETIAQQKGPRP